jgi:hypothetical protein
MSKTLRVSTEYTLDTPKVTITGDLYVLGDNTVLETENSSIKDNVIVLNDGETGLGVTAGAAGLEIDRGTAPSAALRWNEITDRWEISSDGVNFLAIVASSTGTAGLQHVVEDDSPQLGGDLDVNGFSITSDVNTDIVLTPFDGKRVQVNAPLSLQTLAVEPSMTAGNATIYSGPVSSGGTGVYVSNSLGHPELISKKRALVFSLIF